MKLLKLHYFDLTRGLPTAVRVLHRAVGLSRLLKVLVAFVVRKTFRDPFRALPRQGRLSPAERFSRHQLRPVVVLYDVLQDKLDWSQEDALTVVGEVVAQTGAKFIASNFSTPTAAMWNGYERAEKKAFAERITHQFLNAETSIIESAGYELSFDVTRCHFAQLCRELDRPELARLFCRADSVYFDRPDVPIQLTRLHTIADGSPRCEFRFSFKDGTPGSDG